MKLSILFAGAAGAALGLSTVAQADTIYSNPFNGLNGDCSWSTACAATVGAGDVFAAQEFTLTQGATITSAAFEEYPLGGGQVTDVNWGFLEANGTGGLPGTILQAGTDTVSSYGTGANGSVEGFFNTGPIHLGPGTYYFAVQGISSAFTEYLGNGMASSGAATTTYDGGLTWVPKYDCTFGSCAPSVAVSLFGTSDGGVPEPATWALMLVGFAGLGGALRRRGKAVASA